ncbi:MAG: hypothetical protein ACI4Q3_06885 [Kiritimatiellia bacterium]
MKAQAIGLGGLALALTFCVGCGKAHAADNKDQTSKTAESTVVTNDNGSVSRTFVECSVTTNGSMVTERRRETRTNMDTNGNVLETSTSEYAQSYSVGDASWKGTLPSTLASDAKPADTETFMGLKFGDEFKSTNFVNEAGDPILLRTSFKPKKPLAGFDDYYVYVTPKTHKIVKVSACAKEAIDPGSRWRRHYLIEALEKRYQTWARLCSWFRPFYAFDVAPGRQVTVCLAGSSQDYETVITAYDEDAGRLAGEEFEEIREEARKKANQKRNQRVTDAADAF